MGKRGTETGNLGGTSFSVSSVGRGFGGTGRV